MEFLGLGWRDLVLATAGLAAVYMVLSLLKLAHLWRQRTGSQDAFADLAPLTLPPQLPDPPIEAPVLAESGQPAGATSFSDQLAAKMGFDEEMARLKNEVQGLRQEVEELRAARRVSPQYADAMALAQRGYDARGIAAECGISVGEAELVSALSRTPANIDDEVDDGGDDRDARREPR